MTSIGGGQSRATFGFDGTEATVDNATLAGTSMIGVATAATMRVEVTTGSAATITESDPTTWGRSVPATGSASAVVGAGMMGPAGFGESAAAGAALTASTGAAIATTVGTAAKASVSDAGSGPAPILSGFAFSEIVVARTRWRTGGKGTASVNRACSSRGFFLGSGDEGDGEVVFASATGGAASSNAGGLIGADDALSV